MLADKLEQLVAKALASPAAAGSAGLPATPPARPALETADEPEAPKSYSTLELPKAADTSAHGVSGPEPTIGKKRKLSSGQAKRKKAKKIKAKKKRL